MTAEGRGRGRWSNVESGWWERASHSGNFGVLNSCLSAKRASDLKVGLRVVDEEVALCHVFKNSQSIHRTGDELLVSDLFAQVL